MKTSLLETRARASFDIEKLLVLTNLSAFTFCDAPWRIQEPEVFLSPLFMCACVDLNEHGARMRGRLHFSTGQVVSFDFSSS